MVAARASSHTPSSTLATDAAAGGVGTASPPPAATESPDSLAIAARRGRSTERWSRRWPSANRWRSGSLGSGPAASAAMADVRASARETRRRSSSLRSTAGHLSATQRLEQELRRLPAGEVLLAGDEVPIADGEAAPETRLHVVGPELFHLVLDAPGHDMPVAGKEVHLPDCPVGEVLLDVGEAGDRPSPRKRLTAGELRVAKNGHPVAKRAGDLSRLEELDEFLVKTALHFEREHRGLAAGDENGVEVGDPNLVHVLGILDKSEQPRRGNESHRHQIAGRVSTRVSWVAHRVGLALSPSWAEHVELVTRLAENEVRVGQFAPPEAHRPSGRGRGRGVRDDDRHPLPLLRVDDVRVSK